MKYLVVSDNHSDREILVDLKNEFENQVDLFLHCGDSELPDTDPLWDTFQVVCGNCDYGGGFPNERIIKTPLDTIYMTHGHLADVRFGVTKLGLQAQQADASIALFGHTHQIACEKVGNRIPAVFPNREGKFKSKVLRLLKVRQNNGQSNTMIVPFIKSQS